MEPIRAIAKLAAMVMFVDNEVSENELKLFGDITRRIAPHLEERAGVYSKIVNTSDGRQVRRNFEQLNTSSSNILTPSEMAEIANQTIGEYNQLDADDLPAFVTGIAECVREPSARFHSFKCFLDIVFEDGQCVDEERQVLEIVAKTWELNEDALDLLFAKTGREWLWKSGRLVMI
jgi:hypothetical protein